MAGSRFYAETGVVEIRAAGLGTNGSSNEVKRGFKCSFSFSCSSRFAPTKTVRMNPHVRPRRCFLSSLSRFLMPEGPLVFDAAPHRSIPPELTIRKSGVEAPGSLVEHGTDDSRSRRPALAMRDSLADDFHQDPLAPTAVELAVEDLLPGPEVELGLGDRYHDFAPHDLALHVGVSVIFAGTVVLV